MNSDYDVLPNVLLSPDLCPCNFHLFLSSKEKLKETRIFWGKIIMFLIN
jgi:hypothetical protein